MGLCIVSDVATHPHPAQARHAVLIVEDDADIGNLLVDLLTDEGYALALLRERSGERVQDAVRRSTRTVCSSTAPSQAATAGRGMTPPGCVRRKRPSR